VTAQRLLADAELAQLPKSATGIKVITWSTWFSGKEHLRFNATHADIDRFLAQSPVLLGVECHYYSKDRMRLIRPDDYLTHKKKYDEDGNEYFDSPPVPSWYRDEIKGSGRRYRFRPDGYNYGELIIDYDESSIYVGLTIG